MKIKRIDLGEDELPETVTVELSVTEAVLVARLICTTSLDQMPDNMVPVVQDLWDGFSGSFFNRFWSGGFTEAERDIS